MNDTTAVLGIIAGAFGVLGAIVLAVGMVRRRMVKGWLRTTGQIIPRGTLSRAGLPARYPTFQWQDAHGAVYSRTSNVHSSFGPSPGTVVPVLYDPKAPDRGVIDSFVQRGTIFTVIGVVILVIGVVVGVLALVTVGG